MTDYEKICDFENLYKAHRAARLGKRNTAEVVQFEMNLSMNLIRISDALKNKTYRMSGYYSFMIHDPKNRTIHALHYVDRVVQHCVCDEVLSKLIEPRLIYDNAACRIGKGTHFALDRVEGFLHEYVRKNRHDDKDGTDVAAGYFLKCDIQKFFDNIDHQILKEKLYGIVCDQDVLALLYDIIDSYEVTPGKGLPLGNQTSQWFAIFYLNGFDRLIKEKLRIRYYSRYMDDCVLIHRDKEYLRYCKDAMSAYLEKELGLCFNGKTQIFPVKNGVDYLGWHFYVTDTGKVIRKVRNQTKKKYKRKVKDLQSGYYEGKLELADVKQVLNSYKAHLEHGDTYQLRSKVLAEVWFRRNETGWGCRN